MSPASETVAKPSAENQSGFGRWLLVLAAGLVVVSVLGYRVLSRNSATPADAPVTIAATEPAAIAAPTANAEPAPVEPVASAAEPAPVAPTPESASAAPEPTPSAAAATAAPAADLRRITVKSKPPKVRFFHFGKQVGVTPFVLEFKPGERHAYEAGLPGYGTRKVVIDGSKPEITIGLTREKR